MFSSVAFVLSAVVAIGVPAGAHVASGSAASAREAVPCFLAETNRHHVFKVQLDRDAARERIDVFNFDQAGPTPLTGMMVCDRRDGRLRRVSAKEIWGPSPGPPSSGLTAAWVGDLNRDSRVEVAVRDVLTPSAGEELTILRQRKRYSLAFQPLQVIPGDRTIVKRRHGRTAIAEVTIRANHATDGRQHTEIWKWSRQADRWRCATDCRGRP